MATDDNRDRHSGGLARLTDAPARVVSWRQKIRQGIARTFESGEAKYARARAEIGRYAAVTDPEAHRMAADVFTYLHDALADIKNASSQFIPPSAPLGSYRLASPDNVREIKVEASSEYDSAIASFLLWQGSKEGGKAGRISINNIYDHTSHYEGNRPVNDVRLDALMKDVSILARLMPPEHQWEGGMLHYKNEKERYDVGGSWTNRATEAQPHLAITSLHITFDEKHIPVLLTAVDDILAALKEKTPSLPGASDQPALDAAIAHARRALNSGAAREGGESRKR